MSMTADRLHRNLKRIQRYCTKCGAQMHRVKSRLDSTYDPRTGEEQRKFKFYWACRATDWLAPSRHSGHDVWGCAKPRHWMK